MIKSIELKKYLGVSCSGGNSSLQIIINKAISFAENHSMQVLKRPGSVITQISDNNNYKVFLNNYHNVEISEVYKNTGTDFAPVWTKITDDGTYFAQSNLGIITFKSNSCLVNAIKVEYFAGFTADNCPEDLKGALYELSSVFNGMAGSGKEVKAETVDGDRIEFAITNGVDKVGLSDTITSIFDKYRKYDFSA